MKCWSMLSILFVALPACAQTWDLRVEYPLAQGQNLPNTMVKGTIDAISGKLDTGNGAIFTANHRIIRIGPILKFDWGLEFAQFRVDGKINNRNTIQNSRLKQYGFGAGVNAQFWVPFTPLAGEVGLIQRFQKYRFETSGAPVQDESLSRTWMRVGIRCGLPFPVLRPYLAASYQQPFSKDKPVRINSVSDLAELMSIQKSGQEVERLWTFGAGVQF